MNPETGTQFITVPYRAFSLILALLVIWEARRQNDKYPFSIWCIAFYWCILLFRLIDDSFFRLDLHLNDDNISRNLWLIIGSAIPVTLAFVRSFRQIDMRSLYNYCLLMVAGGAICAILFNSDMYESGYGAGTDTQRAGLIAMNPITLGHLGVALVFISLFIKRFYKMRYIRLIQLALILIGLTLVVKAASRGPFVVLIATFAIYVFIINKKWGLFVVGLFVMLLLMWPFIDDFVINSIVRPLAPSLYTRIMLTLEYGDLGRAELINQAITLFKESPVFGSQFTLYKNGNIYYAHNILIDSLVCGGIIGFTLLIIPMVRGALNIPFLLNNRISAFIILIFISQILAKFASGSFFLAPQAGVAICGLILFRKRYNEADSNSHQKELR